MGKKRKILSGIAATLVFAVIAAGIWAYRSAVYCRQNLSVARYSVAAPVTEEIRILQLSDLHSWTFGEDNADLIRAVKEQSPDLIVMTGDMLDKSDANGEVACRLIRDLVPVAPVYYSYGNHEYAWMEKNGESLTPALTEAGARVLDVAFVDVEVRGQKLRLGGYHGYYRQPGMFGVSAEQHAKELAFADAFENTDRCKILLCHIPTAWLDWDYMDDFPVDLVLTGHYHGGQVRLPVIGGLVAPYVGWFPEYTEGFYRGEQAACILSTGLGASPNIPRINNLPQIVVADLIPAE